LKGEFEKRVSRLTIWKPKGGLRYGGHIEIDASPILELIEEARKEFVLTKVNHSDRDWLVELHPAVTRQIMRWFVKWFGDEG
jgi:hypothetical protein